MKFLKVILFGASLPILVSILLISCGTTNTQTKTINTIGSLEQVTDSAYRSYVTLVIKGSLPTNDVPKASKIFNDFQTAALLATVVAKNDTNALAPSSLLEESAAAVALFNQLKGK